MTSEASDPAQGVGSASGSDEKKQGAAHGRDRRPLYVLLGLSLAAQAPFLPMGISPLDEGSILSIAEEIRRGEVLYRDVITTLAPLIYELLALVFRFVGDDLLVARCLQAVVLAVCTTAVFTILRRSVGSAAGWVAALCLLGLKVLGFPLWTILNYSQLALALSFCALLAWQRFLPERRIAWLALAGVLVGLTVLTKQNLGGILTLVICLAVFADWLIESRRVSALLARAGVLAASAFLPVGIFVARYVSAGAFAEFLQRTVLDLLAFTRPYFISMPPLLPWSRDPEELGRLVFAYLPGPLVDLVLQGRLSLAAEWAVIPLELAVKLCYFGPPLLWVAVVAQIARDSELRADRQRVQLFLAHTLFAALTYVSMLYRADWAHLMNIYAPQVLLASMLGAYWVRRGGWAKRVVWGVLAAWLLFSSVSAAALFGGDRRWLDTPRGRVSAPRHQIDQTRRLLVFGSTRSRRESIAFLPAQPLFYYLTLRPLPLVADLLLPGIVRPEDDVRIARQLREVDLVVFDPAVVPGVQTAITEYAPKSSAVLARAFRVEAVVSPTAYALRNMRRRPDGAATVADWWVERDSLSWSRSVENRESPAKHPSEPTSWLFYRVLPTVIDEQVARACVEQAHVAQEGEWLSVLPMFDPKTWSTDYAGIWFPEPWPARLEISLLREGEAAQIIHREIAQPGSPRAPIRVPLPVVGDERVRVRLCAIATRDAPEGSDGPRYSPIGWAEVRVLAPAPPN